jgi:4-hydroxybenzoyl-CoA thioesterase
MFHFRRPVRFADVDAARIVFFARYHDYCHDALEGLFEALEGGYPRLTMVRDVGIPTVRLDTTYKAALRYGDVALFEIEVLRIGGSSVKVRHTVRRERDREVCATIEQVFVAVNLTSLQPVPLPDDVRAVLEAHLVDDENGEGVLH